MKARAYIAPSMKIRVASLKEGLNTVEETVSAAEAGLEESHFHEPLTITGEVSNDERMIDVRLHATVTGTFTCDRCAEEFTRTSDIDLRVMVFRRDAADPSEEETDGMLFIGERGETIDLSQEIRDAVYLDMPMRTLCSEECKGLCTVCGADLNESPVQCLLHPGDNRECPHQ